MKYLIHIEQNGKMVPAGIISGEKTADSRFRYLDEYMSGTWGMPISISLPLQKEAFSPEQTKRYFEGLLPEGFTRRSVAQWLHLDPEDYLSILHGLGRECLGAVCVTVEGEESASSYEEISDEQVQALAAEGVTKSAEMVTKSHLSLTGASGKVGLYYEQNSGKWFLPGGTAPSTHIVKQSHIRLDGIVTNEQLSLMTASRCGIEIPESFIINTGNGREDQILFATKRYDRKFAAQSVTINGLPRPLRLHQEDFSQAMSISSSEKYEKSPDQYLRRMFELLRKNSSDPIHDQIRLWDIVIFNYLIGNTDAHVKNFSLLYTPDLRTVHLAPAYDIISTTVYETSTREMSFNIGGKYIIDEIRVEDFRAAAANIGIGEKMAVRRLDRLAGQFREALHQCADLLREEGFPKASELEERILKTGGYRQL